MTDRKMWAIVLAGGEGSRLAETTRRLYGSALPKQFVSFGQSRSFLQATVDRLLPEIPPERIVVVVASRYEDTAREQLRDRAGLELVCQPRSRGTGPGVLLPLVHVLRRDLTADVALIPSDHHFTNEGKFCSYLRDAREVARSVSSGTVLLGAPARAASTDLGWISMHKDLAVGRAQPVSGFHEKPSSAVAERLFSQGAAWNTMLCVARGQALWSLAQAHLPSQSALLSHYASLSNSGRSRDALARTYELMQPADHSRDLMACARELYAMTMRGAGWSDCGTPERLMQAFGPASGVRSTPAAQPMTERISAA